MIAVAAVTVGRKKELLYALIHMSRPIIEEDFT